MVLEMSTLEPSEVVERATALRNKYVNPQLDWYRRKKLLPMILFRASGIITVVLSATIPVLAQSKWFGENRDDVLAVMGLAVAVLTGISAFMGWDRIWRGRRQTESVLEHLLAVWDVEILRSTVAMSGSKAQNHVLQATKELLAGAHTVTLSEAEQFFDGLKPVGSPVNPSPEAESE